MIAVLPKYLFQIKKEQSSDKNKIKANILLTYIFCISLFL